jgi:hypothetical protein
MSATLDQIRTLVAAGDVRISEHGYDELAADGLTARQVVDGIVDAQVIEDYPDYPKGASVLVLQRDAGGHIIHVVWGIPKRYTGPAVLVTAYRPDPGKWDVTFRRRRP